MPEARKAPFTLTTGQFRAEMGTGNGTRSSQDDAAQTIRFGQGQGSQGQKGSGHKCFATFRAALIVSSVWTEDSWGCRTADDWEVIVPH